MPTHNENRVLPFSAEQMYALVLDVANYPEFLPWCVATRVKSKDASDNGQMVADMAVGFKLVKERYSSRISFEAPDHIHVTDIGGPFKHLETDWRFRSHADGCEVDFNIDFAFSSTLLESVMGGLFTDAAHKMMQAFVTRAEAVYA